MTAAAAGTFFVNRMEFARDSRHVYVNVFEDALSRARLHEIEVAAGEHAPGRLVTDGGVGWSGVLGRTGGFIGLQSPPLRVVALRGLAPWCLDLRSRHTP